MADELLPEGLRFFNKKDTQPDFVVGALVVTMNDLFNFCKQNPDLITDYKGQKQLRLQLLRSSKGNLYANQGYQKQFSALLLYRYLFICFLGLLFFASSARRRSILACYLSRRLF